MQIYYCEKIFLCVVSQSREILNKMKVSLEMCVWSDLKGRLNTDTSPQNFWTTFLDNDLTAKIQEKRSGKRNRDTFATVLFLSCSVTPVPRKLDQTILFLSLSHLWLSRALPAVLRR